MKKIILFLTFFIGISAFSQIKVLKNETLVEIGKENSVGLYKKENRFTFNYQDINTSNLNTFRSFSFNDLNGDVSELYKMISDGFIDEPSGNITLELPSDIIELHFEKNYGQPTVQFIQYINKNKKYVGKSQFLNKKQIDKIFGVGTTKQNLYKKAVEKHTNANQPNATQTYQNQVTYEQPKSNTPASMPSKTKKSRK